MIKMFISKIFQPILRQTPQKTMSVVNRPIAKYLQVPENIKIRGSKDLEETTESGIMDFYNSFLVERGSGTKEEPTQVPSAYHSRIVGCDCYPENETLNWFWIHKDEPRSCDVCGHWYVLRRVAAHERYH